MSALRLRKDGQPDRRYLSENKHHNGSSRGKPYDAEKHWRWLETRRPNPEHVLKLRAGIAEFRQMLESVSLGRHRP